MPQVPGLIPEVNPQTSGTPNVSVDAPVAAFGGNVGLALEKLGGEIGKSSDVIWQRAVQLQEQQNKTEHDFAEAEYIKQSAAENAKFNTLEGLNAGPKALEQHINNLEDIRRTIGSSLSNGRTQQMFAATSNDTTARYVVNATNHSVSQVHSAYTKGLTLKQGTIGKELADTYDPDRPELTKDLEDRFEASSRLMAQNSGLSTKVDKDTGLSPAEMYARSAKTTIALEIASRLSQTDPDKAQKYIETQHEAKVLQGPDYDKAKDSWRRIADPLQAIDKADDIYNRTVVDGQQKAPLSELLSTMDKEAKQLRDNDPVFNKKAADAMIARYGRGRREEIDQYRKDEQTIAETLIKNQAADNDTYPALAADPEVKAIFERNPKLQEKYLAGYGRRDKQEAKAKASAEAKQTAALQKEYQEGRAAELRGMATDREGDGQANFLDTDLKQEFDDGKISGPKFNELVGMRGNLLKNQDAYNHVDTAMKQLRNSDYGTKLQSLDIYKRDPNNPEKYDGFQGTLFDAINEWKAEHDQRLPTSKEMHDNIAPLIIQGYVNRSIWGDSNKVKLRDIPETFKSDAVQKAKDMGMPYPTDTELRRSYVLYMMTTLYGNKGLRKTDLTK